MKRIIKLLLIVILLTSCTNTNKALPLPELEDGLRGELGIDKNINEKTIDNYLNREDAVYRDVRMLKDEANYEAIGGDSYLSGFVKGFEVVPYPYLCNVKGLPAEVGESYTGKTLFSVDDNNNYEANYKESMHILESLFPKDKTIFLMCGGGGYAGMTKNLLVSLGWDPNKIYNTGGYWYYEGKNKVETKYEENGETLYDFSKVVYHPIEFSSLTSLKGEDDDKGEVVIDDDTFIQIKTNKELIDLTNSNHAFAIYVYLPGCSSCAAFYPIVKEYVQDSKIVMYSVSLKDIYEEDNFISEKLDYAPSVFIYDNGVLAYLDSKNNDDLPYYKSKEELSNWFNKYIDISKLKDECDTACKIG